jgi:hypothetical protein
MRGMLILAGAALTLASPAAAGDTGELACLEKTYTAAQRAELNGLIGTVNILGTGEDPALARLAELVTTTASACAAQLDWSEAELQPALLFEFGRLMEAGFLRNDKLTEDEMAAIDAALATGDRSDLWAALEEQLGAGMAGDADTVSDQNVDIFGSFILETGVGLDLDKAELVGVYLAAKAMQRASARQFAAM